MLWKGREVASYFHNTDEEDKVHIVASQWLNYYCTRLDSFGEWLTYNDFVTYDKAI
jgi:hypothetical protein